MVKSIVHIQAGQTRHCDGHFVAGRMGPTGTAAAALKMGNHSGG